jgi:glycosyltransferase involved in cell wall biosynthesis
VAAPRFSILTPVYRPPPEVLEAMLDSVGRQTSSDWEHVLVDDCSDDQRTRGILERAAAADPRLRVHHREQQGGIVDATNDALGLAGGEFVAFLDHDDELHPRALETMSAAIDANPEADYLYSDEDKIDERGLHFDPFVKPGWSPDRLRTQMYLTHFRVVRRSLVESLGGLRRGFEGSQDWDLALRVAEQARSVVHVPEVLYHWRTVPGSAAAANDAKPWAHEASRRAVADSVKRLGIEATAENIPGYPGHYWMRPALVDHPLVSIVIPTAGASAEDRPGVALVAECIESLVRRTSYDNYEFVVVVDDHAPEGLGDRLRELAGDRLKLVDFEGPFNFSAKINLGVRESSGEQILLLNDDIAVVPGWWRPSGPGGLPSWGAMEIDGQRTWIESMLVYAKQPGAGAVGAKLYRPDGALQHGGVICREGRPAHAYYLRPGDDPGYASNLVVASNFLALTAACLMTPREVFDRVGGFDEELPLNYNDVDYCLKLHREGLRSVLVPEVEMLHLESASRGDEPPASAEVESLRSRWGDLLDDDPFYGSTFDSDNFTLPPYGRRGEFRDRTDPLATLDRIRRTYRSGGKSLLAERLYGRLLLRRGPR